jgi:hypothetical protein
MSIDCIAEKKLKNGTTLRLQTWISDVIRPGKRMYQLALTEGSPGCQLTIQFPTNYEHFTEAQVRGMYKSIKSREDLVKIMDEERQSRN